MNTGSPSAETGAEGIHRAARIILSFLTVVGAISTDFFVMSLPNVAATLGSSPAETQLSVSAFVITFGFGQVFWGPLSDRFGRRPVLFTALGVYVLSCVGCAFAWNIETLIAWRFVQGFGACAGPLIARAIVRDAYRGEEAARLVAFMAIVLGITPILAPLAGVMVSEFLGWRFLFIAMALAVGSMIAAVAVALPETSPPSRDGKGLLAQWTVAHVAHLRNPRLLFQVFLVGLCGSSVFSFISGSSFVYVEAIGASAIAYSLAFMSTGAGYVCGATALMRSTAGERRNLRTGLGCWTAGGLALAIIAFIDLPKGLDGVLILTLPIILYMFGLGYVLPIATARALAAAERDAGAASGLIGMFQYLCAAGGGVMVALLSNGTHFGMCVVLAVSPLLALLAIGARHVWVR
jgi:DHA1 family bicyclomycin/chloramphenicol resistance-like MFS transporter